MRFVYFQRKLRSVQKSVEPNAVPSTSQQPPDERQDEEPARRNSQPTDAPKPTEIPSTIPKPLDKPPNTIPKPIEKITTTIPQIDTEIKTPLAISEAFQDVKESPSTDPTFPVEFEDNFDFKPAETKDETDNVEKLTEKPKFTEKELKVLRLQLENAEYLQLKSLLQAKINSEQFEIVKLRSHIALKNKQEGNTQCKENKENKENFTPEEQELLKQKLMKENAMLEQKRLNLVNQIFQERVACIQLKIELAMKEIMSKS